MKSVIGKVIDIKFFFLVLITLPFLVAGHELGHIIIGKIFGFKAYFFVTASLVSPTKYSSCYPFCQFEEFLVNLGGPLMSWFIILFGFVNFLRTRKKEFLLGLSLIAPFFHNFLWMGGSQVMGGFSVASRSDEAKIADFLNLPSLFVSGFFVLISLSLLLLCYRKIKPEEKVGIVTASVFGVLVYYLFFFRVLSSFFKPEISDLLKITS